MDSSEFYVEGDTKWTLFNGLNPAKYGFKSLVLENRIFIIGIEILIQIHIFYIRKLPKEKNHKGGSDKRKSKGAH